MFKGLGNLANLGSLMKQAQEMGGKMQAMQDQLRTKRATGVTSSRSFFILPFPKQ